MIGVSTVSLLYTTFFKQVCTRDFSWGVKPSLLFQDIDFPDHPLLPSVLARFTLGKYLISIKVRESCSIQTQVLLSCMSLLTRMQHITCFNYPWNNKRRKWSGRGQEWVVQVNHDAFYLFFSEHYLTYSSSFSGSILTLRTLPAQSLIKAFAHQSLISWQFLVDLEQGREFCTITHFWAYGYPSCIWKRHKLISLLFTGLSKR